MIHHGPTRRGTALLTVLIIVMVLGFTIVGVVGVGGRSQTLAAHRINTARAFYAAESGISMAMKELASGVDEDGDGTVGSISDDDDDATDPVIGGGRVSVARSTATGQTILVSTGSCGSSRRKIEVELSSD